MKHKTIITRLCYFLNKGYGINEALAELGLTSTYLEHTRRADRVKFHQAHQVYRERLQREIVNRARLGRDITRLERALDNLPLLSLPKDDQDEEREWRRRNSTSDDEEFISHNGSYLEAPYIPEILSQINLLAESSDDSEDAEDEPEDKPAKDPPRRPRKHLPPEPGPKPAGEATPAPRSRPQASDTPFAALSRPPEDANQRPPEPEPDPALHWVRLFTGRAIGRDADGRVVRTILPGEPDYPHQFINWE